MNVPQVQGTGLTRYKLKRPGIKGSKMSGTKGSNAGRPAKMVTYCPVCPYSTNISQADPERWPNAPTNRASKFARCQNGHQWIPGGVSHHSDKSIVIP